MIGIINCGSSKTIYIEQIVDEFDDYKTLSFLDLTPESLSDLDGIIISGAPILLTETDHSPFQPLVKIIIESNLPMLGICFGHQLISLHFGGYVTKMKEDRSWQIIEVLEECQLFSRMPAEFEMMEDHCETASIPPEFKHLAVSDACINEAMMHNEKPIFSVQFHPEVSGNMGRVLLENFVRICGQA
jgi:GMP synthase (glutamine-hydrolysing) A subunit